MCQYSSLPGVDDVSDNYIFHPFGGDGGGAYGDWYGSRNAMRDYDLQVNQPLPFAVVSSFLISDSNGGSVWLPDVEIVCVTPNMTQRGSRVVDDKTPWKTDSQEETG